MDFSHDETQRAVAELAGEVLGGVADGAAEAGGDYDEAAWAALAKVGLLSLAVPTELGGDGLGIGVVAMLWHEIGKRAVTVPAFATLGLGVLPIVAHGTAEQQAALLPGVTTGDAVLTGAPSEPAAALTGSPATTAERRGADWEITGVKAAVPYAEQAHRMLLPAAVPGGSGVFLVDPHAGGVTLTRTPSSSGAPEYTVRLDAATAELLGTDDTRAAAATLRRYALAGAVAAGSGALAGALELTTAHLRTRHQFGKPLATFQAVAQQIADVYIAARTVQLATTSATWRLAAGLDAADDLDLAAYWLAAEALPALRTCHHLHGGLGVDVSYPLYRYYSTIKDLVRFLGGERQRLVTMGG
ncbi:MAG: acyl-CoA dehydrogenase [Actinophytocola sp.]|nr:acyl-CoA dehydrogenase [Actinophytocola sp.]